MTILDFIVIGLAAFLLVMGLFKGFLKQCFGIAAFLLAVILTTVVYTFPMQWLEGLIPTEGTRRLASLVLTFVVMLILFKLLSMLLLKIFTKNGVIKVVDKLLGAVFGVFIVYFVFGVLLALMFNTADNVFVITKRLFKDSLEETWISRVLYENNVLGKWFIELIANKLQIVNP